MIAPPTTLVARKVTLVTVGNDAGRREGILLADRSHGDGAVGLDRAAQIAFDEFAAEMQGPRVGGLDAALWHGPVIERGKGRHDDHERQDHDRSCGPVAFGPLAAIGALVGSRKMTHGGIARGTKTRK
jgi:hypothetical protein